MYKKNNKVVDVNGKKVFVRVDYNVPFDDKMNITNDTRMVRTLPTLNYLLDHGAALVIACHIGRPTEAREDKFSTKYLVKHLSELLGRDVKWASDCVGAEADAAKAALKPGDVLLHGHTHVLRAEEKDGLLILNPGSTSIPKEGNPPTYATLEDGLFRICTFDGEPVKEVQL